MTLVPIFVCKMLINIFIVLLEQEHTTQLELVIRVLNPKQGTLNDKE